MCIRDSSNWHHGVSLINKEQYISFNGFHDYGRVIFSQRWTHFNAKLEAYIYSFFIHLLEMHRTQSEFDDNLTFKVFIFQFINFYSSIFYIAFFKGRFVGYPGRYNYIFGTLRNEDVSNILELITKILGSLKINVSSFMYSNFPFLISVQQWWMFDWACSTTCCHNDWETNDKQCTRNPIS